MMSTSNLPSCPASCGGVNFHFLMTAGVEHIFLGCWLFLCI
jgi:hypothetical protein